MDTTPDTPLAPTAFDARVKAAFLAAFRPAGERRRFPLYLLLCFLVPGLLLTFLFALNEVFPFGDNSLLILDMNGQYIGFFNALRDAVYGDGSLLYSFSRSLGGEMMGVYAYYLASPLSYLVALFPKETILDALFVIFALKSALAGLSFGFYIDRHRFASPVETVLFSTLYALSSYVIVMQHNTMWIDCLAWLPLLTYGIEELITTRHFKIFVVSLSMCLLSNFYIGYMVCIYTLIYFFYYFYAFRANRENNRTGEKDHYTKALLRTAFYSLVAIGIAAVILLTAVYSLSFGKTEFTDPDFTPTLRFDPLAFFSKLLPMSYDTVEPEGLPVIGCGTLTLLLVPLYFANRRFHRKERIASGVLLGVFYLSMSISTLDILWHGLQAPNWLNYRYSFMLIFLLLVLACRSFSRIGDLRPRAVLITGAVLLALVGGVVLAAYEYVTPLVWIVSLSAVAVFTALLFFLLVKRQARRPVATLVLLAAVLAELLASDFYQIRALDLDVGGLPRSSYTGYHERMDENFAHIAEQDKDFYRTETVQHRTTNDVMEIGYRGVTNSTSTLNQKTLTFLHRTGLLSVSHWSSYRGATMTTDSLLGIKYLVSNRPKPYPDYSAVFDGTYARVYENPYALPIAFAASPAIRDFQAAGYAPCGFLDALTDALTGTDRAVFTPLASTDTTEGIREEATEMDGYPYRQLVSDVYWDNYDLLHSENRPEDLYAPDAAITYTATVEREGYVYFYPTTDHPTEMALYITDRDADGYSRYYDDVYYDVLFGQENDRLEKLGYYYPGDTISVTLRMEKSLYFYVRADLPVLYVEQLGEVAAVMTGLKENGITLSEFDDDHFIGTITTTAEKPVVQTTIPYDAGWRVTVDGATVIPYETADALLAFDTAPGTHAVTLTYRPTSLIVGSVVSVASLCLFALLIVVETLGRRGVIHPAPESKTARFLSVFFDFDNAENTVNYLDDDHVAPLPAPEPEPAPDAENAEEATDTETVGSDAQDVENNAEDVENGTEEPPEEGDGRG